MWCTAADYWLATDLLAALGFPVAVNHDYAFVAGDHETVYVYVTPIAAKSLRDLQLFRRVSAEPAYLRE